MNNPFKMMIDTYDMDFGSDHISVKILYYVTITIGHTLMFGMVFVPLIVLIVLPFVKCYECCRSKPDEVKEEISNKISNNIDETDEANQYSLSSFSDETDEANQYSLSSLSSEDEDLQFNVELYLN